MSGGTFIHRQMAISRTIKTMKTKRRKQAKCHWAQLDMISVLAAREVSGEGLGRGQRGRGRQ